MITIGVTGGIGSGKSYICQIIEAMGYPVFYSDQEAKSLMTSDESLKADIIGLFGHKAYSKNSLNRAYLSDKIFKNKNLRKELNQMVHPRVRSKFRAYANQSKSNLVFNEAAILFETGGHKNFDATLLITAEKDLRIQRIQSRDGATTEQIKNRMLAQWPDSKKAGLADFIIDNSEKNLLLPKVQTVIEKLEAQSQT